MRTSRQKLYDDIYYGFERFLNRVFHNHKTRKKLKGVKFDREFYQKFKTTVRPYWAQYGIKVKPLWFKHYYHLTGTLDPRFIPDDIHFFYIVPYFDNFVFMRPLEDKNLHTLLFPGVKRPETVYKSLGGIFRNDDFSPISRDEAFSRFSPGVSYIIKPTMDTGQGHDIRFFEGPADTDTLDELLAPYKDTDYIIQNIVAQHPDIAAYNASSLNTIRVVTLLFQGRPHILSSIFRIGHEGSRVDNVSQGGYQAVIHPDGTLGKTAYTHQGGEDRYVEETQSGRKFDGFTIPCWDSIQQTALDLASKLPHLQFIGWDFAVDEHGDVVLIEFNCQIGQNQENCGPTFQDLTDDVLSEVFAKKMKKQYPRI